MSAALLLARLCSSLLVLAQQPQVTASVDRARLAHGDSLTLTIRVETTGSEPVRIVDPALDGLVLQGARQAASEVRFSGGVATRRITRVLRLRAVRTGLVTIGPVRVHHGTSTAEAPAITVSVEAAAAEPVLEPALRDVLARAVLPDTSVDVVVALIPSRTSVVLGDQIDLVTVAWFRREVRTRLRTPPTFEGPDVQGSWSYRHVVPAGMVTSRRVDGVWYDAFVQQETLFPLRSGPLRIGRASVSYAFPLTYSFLSREVRHVVQSDSLVLDVAPHPEAGQPATFAGAAGVDLRLQVEPQRADLMVGEARTVSVSLSGEGNVALWPEPEIAWPSGLRVYPGDVTVSVRRERGALGGTKTFRYLLVPSVAGRYRVPAPVYPYFDLADGRYAELRAARLEIATRVATTGPVARVTPPTLMEPETPRWPRPTRGPVWLWMLFAVAPPLVVVGRRFRIRRARRGPVGPSVSGDPLHRLDREFRRALERLVPDAGARDAAELSDALRAAGLEMPHAAHVARVRDRLRLRVYGPSGATDADELAAEVQEVLRVLLGRSARTREPGQVAVLVVVVGWATVSVARAQDLSPEALYAAGATRMAVDSFAARAAVQPEVAAHWYNLGSAWYVLGSEVRARAAWLNAARLAPREPLVRRAMDLVPPADPRTARLARVAPFTPDEALLAAGMLWLVGWALMARGSWRRAALAALMLALVTGGYGAHLARQYRAPIALILEPQTPLREAPYGSAPALGRLRDGTAVIVRRAVPGWLLVADGERRGWVHRAEVVRL